MPRSNTGACGRARSGRHRTLSQSAYRHPEAVDELDKPRRGPSGADEGPRYAGGMDDWGRLCELLDDDAEVRRAVTLAAEDPKAFLDENAAVLADLGVTEAGQIDPWLALIDALDDAGALAYLEPDDTGEELADALAGLPRVFAAGAELDEVADVEGSLDEAVRVADRLLAPHGLRLLYLDEGTDDVPLVAVRAAEAQDAVDAASRLGRVARTY